MRRQGLTHSDAWAILLARDHLTTQGSDRDQLPAVLPANVSLSFLAHGSSRIEAKRVDLQF